MVATDRTERRGGGGFDLRDAFENWALEFARAVGQAHFPMSQAIGRALDVLE